jgi:hypothetical protein
MLKKNKVLKRRNEENSLRSIGTIRQERETSSVVSCKERAKDGESEFQTLLSFTFHDNTPQLRGMSVSLGIVQWAFSAGISDAQTKEGPITT